jgi:plastocyanin domain-containing protein
MNKKLWLIVLIAFLITIISISGTYALFETNGESSNELEIGKWKIYVNDEDISLAQTITLNDFTYSVNSHTEDGYFAPGRSASFDIEIDTSESDVSVMYDFDIDTSALDDHPNISLSITNLNTNQVLSTNNCSGVILLSDQNRTITLRMTLNWQNTNVNDPDDTALIGEELEFLITANFKQYLGV